MSVSIHVSQIHVKMVVNAQKIIKINGIVIALILDMVGLIVILVSIIVDEL